MDATFSTNKYKVDITVYIRYFQIKMRALFTGIVLQLLIHNCIIINYMLVPISCPKCYLYPFETFIDIDELCKFALNIKSI